MIIYNVVVNRTIIAEHILSCGGVIASLPCKIWDNVAKRLKKATLSWLNSVIISMDEFFFPFQNRL